MFPKGRWFSDVCQPGLLTYFIALNLSKEVYKLRLSQNGLCWDKILKLHQLCEKDLNKKFSLEFQEDFGISWGNLKRTKFQGQAENVTPI